MTFNQPVLRKHPNNKITPMNEALFTLILFKVLAGNTVLEAGLCFLLLKSADVSLLPPAKSFYFFPLVLDIILLFYWYSFSFKFIFLNGISPPVCKENRTEQCLLTLGKARQGKFIYKAQFVHKAIQSALQL